MLVRRISIVILLAGVVSAAVCSQPKAPVYYPPKIKMPSPNAFDIFRQAAAKVKSAGEVDKAFYSTNHYSNAQKAKVVRKNRAALDKLRTGLRYEYRTPYKYGADAMYPEYAECRTLAKLLGLEAQAKASRGDWSGAVSSCEDGLLFAEMVGYGDGNDIGQLVGIACNHIEHSVVWDAVGHLTSAQARHAADRMAAIRAHHYSTADSLRWEKQAQLLFLQDVFAGKYRDLFSGNGGLDKYADIWKKLPDFVRINTYTRYAAYMDQGIRCAQQPYASHPNYPEIKRSWDVRYAPADILLSIVCPIVENRIFADARSETRNRMLQIAFALQAYRAEHGSYPDRLDVLTPSYLKQLPDDLFAANGTCHYRKDGGKYVLWSIGPDGKDDGGTPIDTPGSKAQDRHMVQRESKGDIVAFINK